MFKILKPLQMEKNPVSTSDAAPIASAITPFLKWAGGKRWFVERHLETLPRFSGRYIEPFLGSAAVFFALRPKKAILADSNAELIQTYRAIRADPDAVKKGLQVHAERHSKKHYYATRDQSLKNRFTRAARFIYLNRTCWNGLYRVNSDGEFNVPKGTKSQVILPSDNFGGIALALKNAVLRVSDFRKTIALATEGDLVFADPPYTVHRNQNGFIKYNKRLFSWDDQIALRDSLEQAQTRGAIVISTNASHISIRGLYKDFSIKALNRASVISSDSSFRGTYKELLITANIK